MQLEGQRGQTLPFWVVGMLVVLTMLFFLANYANAVTWQFRAQNAADSAASTVLSVQANLWNEESTILYSAALDEYRVRSLNQAILNTINGIGGCNPQPGGSCDQDYRTLVQEYGAAASGYAADVQLLRQGNNFTEAGQQADQRKAMSLVGNDCTNPNDSACAFTITVLDANFPAGPGKSPGMNSTDVVACKNVAYFAPALFHAPGSTYQVIGRAAAAVLPARVEAFAPGVQVNPQTGAVYQPPETQWAAAYSAPAYTVDFSGLTVDLSWYASSPIHPYFGSITPSEYSCS